MITLFGDFFASINGFWHLFSYTTFRCGCALLFAFLFVLFLMPRYIIFSHKWQIAGQPIRTNYLPTHVSKTGTPTMGGVLIILATLLACLFFGNLTNGYLQILLLAILSFGTLGFVDDYSKVHNKNVGGIHGKVKLVFQFIFSIVIILYANNYVGSHSYANDLTFPFFRKIVLELGIIYSFLRIFVIVGASNAVNLTDGLDGLSSFPIIISNAVFLVFAYIIGNIEFSKYLYINYQSGAQEICIFLSAVIGATMGFLWYNVKPAQIFMGDTGSLALGGCIGATAVLLKCEFLLAIVGGLFVIEALSVILQVGTFKLTKGKKRIFKIAPIHHHFEKCGWSEMQVVVRFWIIAILFALIGLASLKIR